MTSRAFSIIRWAALAAAVVAGLMALLTLVGYWIDPASYRFGTELGGWRYETKFRYLAIATVELLLAGASIVGFYYGHADKRWVLLHIVALLCFLAIALLV